MIRPIKTLNNQQPLRQRPTAIAFCGIQPTWWWTFHHATMSDQHFKSYHSFPHHVQGRTADIPGPHAVPD